MPTLRLLICCLFATLVFATLKAQDPQFSQFYANPLYQNPAFAGSSLMNRVVLNYRYQWPSLQANYQTFSASYDRFFQKINSGLGVQVLNDLQGFGRLNSLQASVSYAYQLKLSDKFSARAGLQAAYVQRNIGYFGLTFGSQFTGNGFDTDPSSSGEDLSTAVKRYFDASAGVLLFTDQFFLGISAHHLTLPSQSFITRFGDRLPLKIQVQTGWKIPLDDKTKFGLAENVTGQERSLTPAILYKQQGLAQQLDVGLYLTLEPLVVGAWYRGLPVFPNKFVGINNHDAVIALVGMKFQGLSVGYSYDFTISQLGASSGGAHEIAIIYEWLKVKKGRTPKSMKFTPCPKF
ncbi:MAG: type IX secretion system membrane protein PorP/SprF [Verrucomicrobia bacterium]|nr:type IX secretion system membrane protein PorP/SprF [Cytophagales bacterium]